MNEKMINLLTLLLDDKNIEDNYGKWEFTSHLKNKIGRKKHLITPFELSWQVTNKCNLNCEYCYDHASRALKNDLSTEQCHKIIENISKLKIYDVALEGGEPFMRKDILDLIKHLKEKGIFLDIITNGYLITDKIIYTLRSLLDKRTDYIQISIDDINKQGIPDELRRIIQLLNINDVNTRFNIVLTEDNTQNLGLLYSQLKQLNVKGSFTVTPIMPLGKANELNNPSIEQLLKAFISIKQIENEDIPINGIHPIIKTFPVYTDEIGKFEETSHKKRKICSAAKVKMNINSIGNIYPCVFLQYEDFLLGHVIDNDIEGIWNSSKIQEVRGLLSMDTCNTCSNIHCGGGCLGVIYANNKSFDGIDSRCINY